METLDDDDEERSIIDRFKTAIGVVVGLAALAAIAGFAVRILGNHSAPTRVEQISIVKLLPPPATPPPPTPPPKIEPQPTVEPMVEQKQMMEPEAKPDKPQRRDEAPKSHEKAPGPLGLNAKGEGAGDAFGLVGKPGGNGLLGDGEGGGGGSRWGWYASEVQATIEEALRNNPHTRDAALGVQIKIWPDKTGRITRVDLDGTTGDPVVDSAIKNEALNGLQLQEPPPADLPQDGYRKAAEIATVKEAERAKLASEVILLQRKVDDREAKNAELFRIGNDILTRYERFGLGAALAAREPFVGITRVKLENLVQDYQDKLLDQKIRPGQPLPNPTPAAKGAQGTQQKPEAAASSPTPTPGSQQAKPTGN